MLRRTLFGILWFIVFSLAVLSIGSVVVGARVAREAPPAASFQEGFDHGFQAGHAVGYQFGQRYGRAVLASAAALALIGTVAGVLPGTKKRTR